MSEDLNNATGRVVYLRSAEARVAKPNRLVASAAAVRSAVCTKSAAIIALLLLGGWATMRIVLCTLFVLVEPIVRMILVPVAYLSFAVTVIFGFVIGDPRFPKWGMLAFSFGALWLYWLFVGLMSLFMRVPHGQD